MIIQNLLIILLIPNDNNITPLIEETNNDHDNGDNNVDAYLVKESKKNTRKRRIIPGMNQIDLYNYPFEQLKNKDSSYAVQEYIQQLIHNDPSNLNMILKMPEDDNIEYNIWILEHLKQFIIELNQLIVYIGDECNSDSCPKMMAGQNIQYRCAAHKPPKDCSAYAYACHTIDQWTSTLCDPKLFPSQLTVPESSVKQFEQCARRLYRIFLHSYHHHFKKFKEYEDIKYICTRFILFCSTHNIADLGKEAKIDNTVLHLDKWST